MLERELQGMRERAERAEQREETHQSRWAAEVDQLRLQVKGFKPLAQQARQALDSVGLLRRQLQAAEAVLRCSNNSSSRRTAGEGGSGNFLRRSKQK